MELTGNTLTKLGERTMKRLLASSSAATVVVFGLFVLMVALIHQDAPASVKKITPVSIFLTIDETPPEEKDRRKPPKEPEEIKPPKEVKPVETKVNPKVDGIDGLELSLTGLTTRPGKGGPDFFGGNNDGSVQPMVMIQPQYPPIALQNNQQGWVKLGYNITPMGTVKDVRVIESKPRGIFDKSARKALYRWKYKPSIVDGVAVASNGHTVMLEFNLEDD